MEITIQLIMLILTLIILGLLLKKWQPPIKEQYVFIILSIVGICIGYYLIGTYQGFFAGFIGAGLVFYKDELVKEARDVKESFEHINNIKDNKQDTTQIIINQNTNNKQE